MVQGRLPLELKYLRSFNIYCTIRDTYCGMELCDLGVSIKFVPLLIFNRVTIEARKHITITLQLVNCSICPLTVKLNMC